jgi:hypothetical protein
MMQNREKVINDYQGIAGQARNDRKKQKKAEKKA